jgi:hypothetical protein
MTRIILTIARALCAIMLAAIFGYHMLNLED